MKLIEDGLCRACRPPECVRCKTETSYELVPCDGGFRVDVFCVNHRGAESFVLPAQRRGEDIGKHFGRLVALWPKRAFLRNWARCSLAKPVRKPVIE